MRFRNIFLGVGSVLVLAVLLLSDPDNGLVSSLPFGAGTLSTLIILVTSVLYIGLLHLARKALIDYVSLDEYFKRALLSSEGAGMALIAVAVMMLSIAVVIFAAVK